MPRGSSAKAVDTNEDQSESPTLDFARFTSEIVSAYVGRNSVPMEELPNLIGNVATALQGLSDAAQPRAEPAVSTRRSVRPEAIICLECGSSQKMMKRHLSTAHGQTVDEYREKWRLPASYPMVAPEYSKARAAMARKIGLGTKSLSKRRRKRR